MRLLILLFLLIGCASETKDGRVKYITGTGNMRIYLVDDHIYIVNRQGGVIHSESCHHKKHDGYL